jgi:lactoylglutathione lyase
MARINHIALKVDDLEGATKFYEEVFGFRQVHTGHSRGHTSRHMTDGTIDIALMKYDSEDVAEAKLVGPGPCIHHFGIQVEDREAFAERVRKSGAEILSEPNARAIKFRTPHGVIAELLDENAFNYSKEK